MLELASLSRAFGGLSVIDRLDLRVEAGEILGVLGPNGAGKTTLFNMIAGVLPPSGGRILLDGRDITTLKPWHRCRLGISRTYQTPKPFSHMSVFENVLVAAVHGGRSSMAQAASEAEAVLVRTGLAHRALTPAGQLALLDMKQLELAKALAVRPRLLLLDEIAGGLTEAECDVLLETIADVHRGGVTIVWIEHVIRALRRLVSRLAVLAGGNFIAVGTPADVLADRRVREAYLGT
ncbi:MAG TPA: ABC transporter ATP-binding protein [Stellaceae bacterium]|nr:ABC transporter ATP-binding protein [Stellaceae bacterium]